MARILDKVARPVSPLVRERVEAHICAIARVRIDESLERYLDGRSSAVSGARTVIASTDDLQGHFACLVNSMKPCANSLLLIGIPAAGSKRRPILGAGGKYTVDASASCNSGS